jgi:hypothetical protein
MLRGFMKGDDTARRVGDITVVLDAIAFRLKAGGAAGDHANIAAEIQELMNLMEGLRALNVVDYHLLNISRELVKANELKVALEQLRRILARQSDVSWL